MKVFYYLFTLLFGAVLFGGVLQGSLFADNNELLDIVKKQNNFYFIENKGQWQQEVKFLFKSKNYYAWITDFGIVYDYFDFSEINEICGNVIKMRFNNVNSDVTFIAKEESETYYNYFIGNDRTKWATNVKMYKEIIIKNIYDGIDIRYYVDTANGDNLRYDFEISPFANPNDITFALEGIDNISLNKNNELEFFINNKSYKHTNLFAFQNINNITTPIECSFIKESSRNYTTQKENKFLLLENNYNKDNYKKNNYKKNNYHENNNELINKIVCIGFDVGQYDKSYKLIIDPLIYSIVIGGIEEERAYAITTDSYGQVHFTGFTYSVEYPTTSGSYRINKIDNNIKNNDVVVSKINMAGTGLVFSTYIGGSGHEVGRYIKVDSYNNIYVLGETNSNSTIFFPIVHPDTNSFLGKRKDGWNAFFLKLTSSGNVLDFSILIGANNNDYPGGFDFILDSNNEISNIVIATQIYKTPVSLIPPYISSNAVQTTHNGYHTDCYIAVISADATEISYGSFLGGTGNDTPKGLVVDNKNNILLTGNTESLDFPISDGAYKRIYSGGGDIFATQLKPILDTILDIDNDTIIDIIFSHYTISYSTYIGGSSFDNVEGIDVDNENNFYIAGHTLSSNFFATPLSQPLKRDSANIFILKMNPQNGNLIYSRSITSNKENYATGIVVDGNKYAHISGYTTSTDYPITWDAFFDTYSANGDALYSVLDSDGGSLIFSSYIGGDQYEYGYGLALDNIDAAYICGATTSNERFPHSALIADSVFVGNDDENLQHIYEKTLGSYDCFIFKSMYKPYPGELETNIDLLGNMFCPGSEINIVILTPYGFYYSGNEFRIQLSDVNGKFPANLTSNIIGTLQATRGGIVKITFPSNANGRHYRIRVISTNPRAVGTANEFDLDISRPYIELDKNIFSTIVCAGGKLKGIVNSNICFNDDNIYTIELSDINGNFTNSTILATHKGKGTFSIDTTISDTLIPSDKYKIRVSSSSPKVVSNEISFEIAKAQILLNNDEISKLQGVCAGDSLDFGFNAMQCFKPDNIFYLILSDTEGNFNIADTIGEHIGMGEDTMIMMKVFIPANLSFSEKYKIKLISTSPQLDVNLGGINYNYTLGKPFIYTNNLNKLEICRKINFDLNLNTNNCFEEDNIFEIYIQSDTGLVKIAETNPNSKSISLFINNTHIPQNTTIIVRATNPEFETAAIPIIITSPDIIITGHLPIELCEDMDFDLNYKTNGCLSDTMDVIVEMSIGDSNFKNPIRIGGGNAFNNSGKIPCKLPDSIDYYDKYYVRIIDSFGFVSKPFLLNINPASLEITSNISDLEVLCAGISFYINFELTGCFDINNIFQVILSDVGGQFNSNARIIGEITSNKSGRIFVQIPLDIDISDIYKIKIISTIPETETIIDLDITIKHPFILIDSFANLSQCDPNTIGGGIVEIKDKGTTLNDNSENIKQGGSSTKTNSKKGNSFQDSNIPYISFITSDCFDTNNIFILQFGKNGDFSNPINVDTCKWNEREFYFDMPENMGDDTFRFRIISSNPMVASMDNGFDLLYSKPYAAIIGSNKPTICKDIPFKFNYQTSICFDSNNIFYLEMSDAIGNFNNPDILDYNTTIGKGVFNITTPENIPVGVVYKLRIRSTSPPMIFVQNQIIFSITGPEILTGNLNKIRTSRNDTLYVPFNCNCMDMEGKKFIAQLSDPYGRFENMLKLGEKDGWESNGKIYARIPLTASDGNRYRIRVICNDPYVIGTNNGKNVVIYGMITAIEDSVNIEPSISPSPFSNELVINTNGIFIRTLHIVDILGITRIQIDFTDMDSEQLFINTKSLEAGTYILILYTDKDIFRKVILNVK